MTATVSLLPAAGTARPSAPSLASLTGIEIRKSLSTRSGRAVSAVAVLIGPLAILAGSLGSGDEGSVASAMLLGFSGMLTALVLLALGALSTAGEWTNKSVQTTFLLIPQRGRVLTAKLIAVALQAAVLAAVAAMLAMGVMSAFPDLIDWVATGRGVAVAVVGGAAFALTGAGIGAALGNTPAALTGTYLVILGVLPILQAFKPEWAEKLDPASSIVLLAQNGWTTQPSLVIAGWVVVSTIAGVVITRRRSVQ